MTMYSKSETIEKALMNVDLLKNAEFSDPVFSKMANTEQNNPNHYATVMGHTLDAITRCEERGNDNLAKLLTLYHDCAKPDVVTINPKSGYDMYPKHEGASAEKAKKELIDEGFGKDVANYVSNVINAHGLSMYMTVHEEQANPFRLYVNHDNLQKRIDEYNLSKEEMKDVLECCRNDVLAQSPVADMGYVKLTREMKMEVIDAIQDLVDKEKFNYKDHNYNRERACNGVENYVTKARLSYLANDDNQINAERYGKILNSYDDMVSPSMSSSKAYQVLAGRSFHETDKVDDLNIAVKLVDMGYSSREIKKAVEKNSPIALESNKSVKEYSEGIVKEAEKIHEAKNVKEVGEKTLNVAEKSVERSSVKRNGKGSRDGGMSL